MCGFAFAIRHEHPNAAENERQTDHEPNPLRSREKNEFLEENSASHDGQTRPAKLNHRDDEQTVVALERRVHAPPVVTPKRDAHASNSQPGNRVKAWREVCRSKQHCLCLQPPPASQCSTRACKRPEQNHTNTQTYSQKPLHKIHTTTTSGNACLARAICEAAWWSSAPPRLLLKVTISRISSLKHFA